MKTSSFAFALLAVVSQHAAVAQEAAPEPATEAPPPDAVPPPPEAAPAPAEPAPPLTEPAPAATAPARPATVAPAAFGTQGQLVVSVDLPFTSEGPQFAIYRVDNSMNGPTVTRIYVQPSVDYFLAPSFSIGAQLGVSHEWIKDNTVLAPGAGAAIDSANGYTTLSAEVRVGYDVPVADTVSVWPRVGVGYTHYSTSYVYTGSVTSYSVPFSFTVPFLWHPGEHFLVGAGPSFSTQLVNKSEGVSGPRQTLYGVTALIGGALGPF